MHLTVKFPSQLISSVPKEEFQHQLGKKRNLNNKEIVHPWHTPWFVQIPANRLLSVPYCRGMVDGEKLTSLQNLQLLVLMQVSALAIHITMCHAYEKQLHAEN